jgi:hypothetical protein
MAQEAKKPVEVMGMSVYSGGSGVSSSLSMKTGTFISDYPPVNP